MNSSHWRRVALMVAAGIGIAGSSVVAEEVTGAVVDPVTRSQPAGIEVQCTPVNISWPPSSSGGASIAGPELSVVRTDFRPKDVPIFLDGRFVGRARFFNGKKGFLYLQPGRYEVVAWSAGLASEVFVIDARPGCRFDIKHRMTKGQRDLGDGFEAPRGKGEPTQWIYGPLKAPDNGSDPAVDVAVRRRTGGPDLTLRPDLGWATPTPAVPKNAMASLNLKVKPPAATVYLDGRMLATGEEISKMVGPLAIPAGAHTVLVRAEGYTDRSVTFEVGEHATSELEVILDRASP